MGLSIGLGIPAAFGVIGAFIYFIKLIKKRNKTQIIPIKHHHHHHSNKKRDIHLKKQRHHHHKTSRKRDDSI